MSMLYRVVWITGSGALTMSAWGEFQDILEQALVLRKYGRTAWIEDQEHNRIDEVQGE